MFRLIVLAYLLQFSIGAIIRGRILLDGDVNKVVRLPNGSNLIVYLQDTSIADASATTLAQVEVFNLFAVPFSYQIEIPNDVSSTSSYSLSARITHNETLLFINDQHISVPIGTDSPIMIDIPVINLHPELTTVDQPASSNNTEGLAWPEMVGKEGTYAVQYIKEKSGLTNVFTILENSPITMDYRTDRVRVFINEKGIVTRVPRVG